MKRMKRFCTLLFCLGLGLLSAQTSHEVEAFGGGTGNPTPQYVPQFFTIQVGDTVRWTNTQGQHNVDGTVATFPSNPEGFTSGVPQNAPWVFEHVFTIPGTYDFECSAFNHSDTQFGTITVVDIIDGIEENTLIDFFIYPNPVESEVNILTKTQIEKIEVLDVSRTVQKQENPIDFNGSYSLDVSELETGIYFIIVHSGEFKGVKRFIKR